LPWVPHADDESSFGGLAPDVLEREDDRAAVVTEPSVADGLDRPDGARPRCPN
jgi:hypothetical protein